MERGRQREAREVIIGLHIKSCIVVPVSFVGEEIWSSGEKFRLEIFFQPSDNYINFKEKTTFTSNTQIYLQKQQELKLTYVY